MSEHHDHHDEHGHDSHGHDDHDKKGHGTESRYTAEERDYYEASVEDAAQKANSADHAKVEKLVREIVSSSDVHEDLKLRMHRDVMARLEEMRLHAHSDREKKVLDQYEGYVKSVDGKFRPAGIDKKFKISVRAGAGWDVSDLTAHGYEGSTVGLYMKGAWWKTGKVFDSVFGQTVDSDRFHTIIEDVEKANEDVDKLKRELELLRAAEKSVGDLIKMSGAGFMTRIRSRGITSFFGSSLDSTKDFFSGVADKYWGEDQKRRQEVSVLIAHKMKDLKEKESLRDATLKKLDQLREQGRVLFEKAFKPEVDVLMAQKETMPESEYTKRMSDLRKKIQKWSEKTGFAHMEVFLDEMLGTPSSKEVPLSPLEVKQRDSNVSKFLKNIIGSAQKKEDIEQFIEQMEQKNPEIIRKIGKGEFGKSASDGKANVEFLKFLIHGKFRDVTLDANRRLKPDVDNIVRYLNLSFQYAKAAPDMTNVLTEFSNHWNVSADHFDEVFDLIAAGRKPHHGEERVTEKETKEKEKMKEMMVLAKSYYKDVTGDDMEKSDEEKFEGEIKKDVRRSEQFLKHPAKKGIMKFFFQGVYEGYKRPLMFKELMTPGFDNFMTVYRRIQKFTEFTTNPKELRKVFIEFVEGDHYRSRNFDDLDEHLFEEILKKVQHKDEEKKEKRKKERDEKKAYRKAAGSYGYAPPASPPPAPAAPPVAPAPAPAPARAPLVTPPPAPAAAPTTPSAGPTRAPKGAPAAAPKAPLTEEERKEKELIKDKKELVGYIFGIDTTKASRYFHRIPKEFPWDKLKEYDREIRFLFTGEYSTRKGDREVTLEGDHSKWQLLKKGSMIFDIMKPENLAALQRMKERLPKLIKESKFTQNTWRFFFDFMLKGIKYDPAKSPRSEGSAAKTRPEAPPSVEPTRGPRKKPAASAAPAPAPEEPAPVSPRLTATIADSTAKHEVPDVKREAELVEEGPEPTIARLTEALELEENTDLAKKLFEVAFREHPRMRSLLEGKHNREKLNFFISGKYKTISDIAPAALKKDEDSLIDLLENFEDICRFDVKEFRKEIRGFFTEGVTRNEEAMKRFVAHIKEINKPSNPPEHE